MFFFQKNASLGLQQSTSFFCAVLFCGRNIVYLVNNTILDYMSCQIVYKLFILQLFFHYIYYVLQHIIGGWGLERGEGCDYESASTRPRDKKGVQNASPHLIRLLDFCTDRSIIQFGLVSVNRVYIYKRVSTKSAISLTNNAASFTICSLNSFTVNLIHGAISAIC